MWQDKLIAIGGIGFFIALVPMIFANEKPPISTSLLTAVILWGYILAFSTLGLWYSAIVNVFSASS